MPIPPKQQQITERVNAAILAMTTAVNEFAIAIADSSRDTDLTHQQWKAIARCQNSIAVALLEELD